MGGEGRGDVWCLDERREGESRGGKEGEREGDMKVGKEGGRE